MKTLLKNMGVSLLTGISFVAGIFLASLAWEFLVTRDYKEDIYVDSPSDITITRHQRVDGRPRFIVAGDIHNGSEYEWQRVSVEIKVYADEALMNVCGDSIQYVGPNESRPFEVECYKVDGVNLPDNIRYEISVDSGWRWYD